MRSSREDAIIAAMSPSSRVHVVFCLRNIDRAIYEALKALALKNPEIRLEPVGCLCNCTRCVEIPFLQINGRIIEGSTHQEILEEVLAALHV
ncbi:MAG: DUF1450 domain-containing protein [Leptolyngbya sp. PLA3]|nr:MAG: DUF1450 domain-containing protein [Cyanobacteria bacterium CYA]MCE7967648.1 DUF1450 domain-containing protein [Leptolyngbya sp. PL-A3]